MLHDIVKAVYLYESLTMLGDGPCFGIGMNGGRWAAFIFKSPGLDATLLRTKEENGPTDAIAAIMEFIRPHLNTIHINPAESEKILRKTLKGLLDEFKSDHIVDVLNQIQTEEVVKS